MTEDVYSLIAECMKDKKPRDPVFTWKDGSPVKDFRGAWSKMCESAKVDVLLHDFRRAAVRNLIRAGVPRDVARKISGHETESIQSVQYHRWKRLGGRGKKARNKARN
jgi:integrase